MSVTVVKTVGTAGKIAGIVVRTEPIGARTIGTDARTDLIVERTIVIGGKIEPITEKTDGIGAKIDGIVGKNIAGGKGMRKIKEAIITAGSITDADTVKEHASNNQFNQRLGSPSAARPLAPIKPLLDKMQVRGHLLDLRV